MSVTCVAKYISVEEALVAKSKLEFYDIPVWFVEEYAARCKWIYLQGASYCHLEVPTYYADDAVFLLNDKAALEDYDPYPPEMVNGFNWLLILLLLPALGYFAIFPLIDIVFHWVKRRYRAE